MRPEPATRTTGTWQSTSSRSVFSVFTPPSSATHTAGTDSLSPSASGSISFASSAAAHERYAYTRSHITARTHLKQLSNEKRGEQKAQGSRTFKDRNDRRTQFAVAERREERRPVGDLAARASGGAVVHQKEVRVVRLERRALAVCGRRTGALLRTRVQHRTQLALQVHRVQSRTRDKTELN